MLFDLGFYRYKACGYNTAYNIHKFTHSDMNYYSKYVEDTVTYLHADLATKVLRGHFIEEKTKPKFYTLSGLVWSVFFSDDFKYLSRVIDHTTVTLLKEFVNICSVIALYNHTEEFHGNYMYFKFPYKARKSAELADAALKYMKDNHPSAFNRPMLYTMAWIYVSYPNERKSLNLSKLTKTDQREFFKLIPSILRFYTLDDIKSKFSLNGPEWSRLLCSYKKNKRIKRLVVPKGMCGWINRQQFSGKLKGGAGNKRLPDISSFVVEEPA